MKHVITMAELPTLPMRPGQGSRRFGAQVAIVGAVLGLKGLGATFITVPVGKRGFPFHNHLGNDEMFIILEGEGTYRYGAREFPIRAGDVCGAPKGGADTAHQIINTGETDLRYVAISTMQDPEIVEYPDSGKYAAIGIAPGQDFMTAHIKAIGRKGESLDYWEGEPI